METALKDYRKDIEDKKNEHEINSKIQRGILLMKQQLAQEMVSRRIYAKQLKEDYGDIGNKIPVSGNFISVLIEISRKTQVDMDNKDNTLKDNKYLLKDHMIKVIEGEINKTSQDYICGYLDSEHIIINMYGKLAENSGILKMIVKDIKDKFVEYLDKDDVLTVGVGKQVRGVENIPSSYRTARKTLQKQFFHGYNKIFYYEEGEHYPIFFEEDIVDKIEELILEEKQDEAISVLKKFVKNIGQYEYTEINYVKSIFISISNRLNSLVKCRLPGKYPEKNNESEILWSSILSFSTLEEIEKFVLEKLESVFNAINAQRGKSRKIYDAMNYVRENFQKGITINDMAWHVDLTPTYLCCCFKKEMGMTINQYTEAVRIEKAKEYLDDDNMKLQEIARKVGYMSASYFSKVFKQTTGFYPSEYRTKRKL